MAQPKYALLYTELPNVEFPSQTAMGRYLKSEAAIWSDYLVSFGEQSRWGALPMQPNGSVKVSHLAESLSRLSGSLDDRDAFHRMQKSHSGSQVLVPPPSASLEGQLILGLFSAGRDLEAHSVFLWFARQQRMIQSRTNQPLVANDIQVGSQLVIAAKAAEALPFHKVSSQRIAGAACAAEHNAQAVAEEVRAAQQINADHDEALGGFREALRDRAKRIEKIFIWRERRRRVKFSAFEESWKTVSDELYQEYRVSLHQHTQLSKQQLESQNDQFQALKDRFLSQMRLRAPVELWRTRAEKHRKNATGAFVAFVILALIAIVSGALIPWLGGDYIASSFTREICNDADPPSCEREFSAKGPLTVAGLLLVLSIILWLIRLQYRVYLSERHLALDAEEKCAFAETFMAMKEETQVGANNEAIVLASLFRPTQDGIIKDDDNSVDISAAAILAKQLGRST